MNRRDFVLASAAATAVTAATASVSQALDYDAEKPRRVGLIGCGWYGKTDLFRLVQVAPVEIVSLCDVDSKQLAHAADLAAIRQKSHKRPRLYHDYRDMLKQRDLDIVLVGTPDHWHPLVMIAAVESGADVYCQKPISRDVVEGAAMLEAARKNNRVVQVGLQRRSTPHLVEAYNTIVREGKLGKIGLVEMYCYYHMRATDNPPDTAPPPNLDYEMWTGPAPMRPYNKLVHPRRWRSFMEYCNGIIGDMCVHFFDTARWMLGLGWPKSVSSVGGIFVEKQSKANTSDTQTVTFKYPDFDLVWQHRTWGESPRREDAWGMTIYGDRGTLKMSTFDYDFLPLGGGKPIHRDVVLEHQYTEDFDGSEPDLELHAAPANRAHQRNFLHAIDTRGRPVSDIEQGYISTASCILANMSMQLGRSLVFDPVKREIPGDDEANKLLRRKYRAPWVHPEPT